MARSSSDHSPCVLEIKQLTDDNNTETIISTGLPCSKAKPVMKIEHRLPIIWTYFDFMETDQGVYQSVRFLNMSILYNKNWTFRVPHFMPIMLIKELTAELSNISALSTENWYHYPYSKVTENPHLSFMMVFHFDIMDDILTYYA